MEMKLFTRLVTLALIATVATGGLANGASIADAIANDNRAPANTERDGDRKPDQVLEFIDLNDGSVVLDWGAGGGYWTELFAGQVGAGGMVYAHQNAGERFESQKAAYTAQFAPFGNIELLPLERGAAIPLDDNSVDAVMVSYLYHHMHYSEASGESFPPGSSALFTEYHRVLKPGGVLVIIEHQAVEGSSRAQSAAWHRVPAAAAKADAASVGLEFAGEAPEIFNNPDDDEMNMWGETGLRGKTTSIVHKYRKP
jgi:predicted methyltransferase